MGRLLVASRGRSCSQSAMGVAARTCARSDAGCRLARTRCPGSSRTIASTACRWPGIGSSQVSHRKHGACPNICDPANANQVRSCRDTCQGRSTDHLSDQARRGTNPDVAYLPLVIQLNHVCLLIPTCCNTTRCGLQQELGTTTSVLHQRTSCVLLVAWSSISSVPDDSVVGIET